MIGVVADDITGANDIGIMFAKRHIVTHVYAYDNFLNWTSGSGESERPDVVILDTNSRLDPEETAYDKVFQATQKLRDAGARMFINKTCSVFRGNIGAEFDAMLDALDEKFAVVVLGFPKNGRTTIEGVHYVHGKRLEDSEFKSDPVHPMTESRLVSILQSQTSRKVDALDYRIVGLGPERLRASIQEKKHGCNYLILDVADQEALSIIARAVKHEPVLCGSSALAEELAPLMGIERRQDPSLNLPKQRGVGLLCAAGSLMPQTAAQIAYMKDQGVQTFELDSMDVLEERTRQEAVQRMSDTIAEHLMNGSHAVLHSANDRKIVEETKRCGEALGIPPTEVSRLVSGSIAEITARVMEQTGQNRLIAAGGETSAAVCERLGIDGLRVWKEIEPGLPSCVSLQISPKLLVLKSGSFGGNDFFEKALQHLLRE
jgi:uncharacterized protein YgbK (DUF1537 family)